MDLTQQIRNEQRHLTEINDSLASLDIAIGFLVSVGGESNRPLLEFITDTLRMDRGSLGHATGKCRLKHTKALWLLLSHERARRMQAYQQVGLMLGSLEWEPCTLALPIGSREML